MKEPKVSVAMATYNGERFLQEQLDSLARQTLLPYELVACDDGSTDGTLGILHRFAEKAPFSVKIYRNEDRLGYGQNFLRAVELSRGDLVAFSDQDDAWLPEKLAACCGKFASKRVSMVIHLAMLADANLQPLGRTWPYLGWFRKGCSEAPSLHYMDVAGMTMVFRREVAEPVFRSQELRLALPEVFSGHDNAMRFLAGAHGSVVPLRRVLALHRCHGGNTTVSHGAAASSAAGYVFSVKGARGRVAAPFRWLSTHTRLARSTGCENYAREAESLRGRAKALRDAATRAEGRLRSMFERSSHVLSRRAEGFAERSGLYQDATGRARARFLRMVVTGRYGRRNRGGLGLWSLAKDCRVAFFSPSVPKASGEGPQQLHGPLEGGSR